MKPSHPRRILINALHARSGGGLTYLREMLPLLAEDERLELHVFLHSNQMRTFHPVDERVRVHLLAFPDGWWRLLLWEQVVLPVLARVMDADIVFSPANFGSLFIRRQVILLRNAFAVARAETRPSKLAYWLMLMVMTGLSVLVCRRVLAVSRYALETLTFGGSRILGGKMEVVHHGVSERFFPDPSVGREDFILAVSDVYVQKSIHTLLPAFSELRRVHPELRLIISGAIIDDWYHETLLRQIDALGLAGAVDFLGRRSHDELVDLYRRCRVFVFPSSAETFGIPLIEAMACGAVVASSNTTAMPEVVGDAAILFDPASTEGITRALIRAVEDQDLRSELSQKAIKRAEQFSWKVCARATADALLRAAGDEV